MPVNLFRHASKSAILAFVLGMINLFGQAAAAKPPSPPKPAVATPGIVKSALTRKVFVVLDAPELTGYKRSPWKNICGTDNKQPVGFKKILTAGGTRWGDEVTCFDSPQKLPKKFNATPNSPTNSPASAPTDLSKGVTVLTLKWSSPTLDFVLTWRDGKKILPLATYRLGLGDNPLNDLNSEKTLLLISQMLTESTSLGWLAEANQIEPGIMGFTLTERQGSLPLPEYLYAYTVEIQAGQGMEAPPAIKPTIVARLKRSKNKSLNSDKDIKVTYTTSDAYRPLVPTTTYHLHTELGPGSRQSNFDNKLKSAVKGSSLLGFVDDLFFGTLSSNYGGIRLGKSLILDNLLQKAFLVSALVEIRGGPLQGLRWYYDIIPQVKSTDRGMNETFRMARASLGWSFDIDMPSPLSDYIKVIDFQPKIGLLDVKAALAVDTAQNPLSPEYQLLTFEARNVLDLAGELGFEQKTPWFRARFWTSLSGAAFGISNKDDVRVFSARTGLDFYHDLVGYDLPFSASLLGFGMFENLSFSKVPKKVKETSAIGLTEISFSTFFLGGGFTLSW